MALIKCEECKKEISDSAKACPNCGYNKKNYSLFEVLFLCFGYFLAISFVLILIFQWYIIFDCMISKDNACGLQFFPKSSGSSSAPALVPSIIIAAIPIYNSLVSFTLLTQYEVWLWDPKIAFLVIIMPYITFLVFGVFYVYEKVISIWYSLVERWKEYKENKDQDY
jgi:hypothetical protein